MRQIIISDATMKQSAEELRLTFKERIELAKLLDKLGVDLIELEGYVYDEEEYNDEEYAEEYDEAYEGEAVAETGAEE